METTLRQMAVALLCHEGHLLLMKRSPNAPLFPGAWGAIGGHLEACELSDPIAACVREVGEETGIGAGALADLRLRFVMLRMRKSELRIQYVYAGTVPSPLVQDSPEGSLQWVRLSEVLARDWNPTIRVAIERYLDPAHDEDPPMVGVMGEWTGGVGAQWVPLTDWEDQW